MDLKGTVSIITGGAKGIGKACAQFLVESGSDVTITDVNDEEGIETAKELGITYFHMDASNYDENKEVLNSIYNDKGRLDIVHLNAGIASKITLEDFDLVRYRKAMGTNLDGPIFGTVLSLPLLRASGGGHIIVTASLAGLVPVPMDVFYGANKHGVVGFVRSCGISVPSTYKVKINAICPSFVDTDIIEDVKSWLAGMQFPLLKVDDVVNTFEQILKEDKTGQCWFVVKGRESEPFVFRNVPGSR